MSQGASVNETTNVSQIIPASPRQTSPFIRAAGLQLCWTMFSFLILDGGFVAFVFVRLSVAYWAGVLLMIARRRNSLTPTDQFYLKYGLVIAFAISLPISTQLVDMAGPHGWMFLRKAFGLVSKTE